LEARGICGSASFKPEIDAHQAISNAEQTSNPLDEMMARRISQLKMLMCLNSTGIPVA